MDKGHIKVMLKSELRLRKKLSNSVNELEMVDTAPYCWLVRLIWGSHEILGKGWWGHLGIFMIIRSIYLGSDWLKFSIWNG